MKDSRFQRPGAWLCICAAMILFAGCAASPPEPVEFTEEGSLEATVTAVDVERRLVSLRDASGNETTIRVPAARNLSQVDSGDKLVVTYSETYRASLAEAGRAESGAAVAAGRAEEGDRPGGFVAAEAVTTVEIVSVAEDGSSVSVRDEEGRLQMLEVQRDEGRAFARELKRGDMVLLEYTEAVALDLQKPAG